MERAIALLPRRLRPLFEKHRAMVVERIIDPDTWRTPASRRGVPNHFLDLDWEGYGKDPFRELPRDYTAAVAKFGRARIGENGTRAVAHRGDVRQPAARVPGLRPARRVRPERHHVTSRRGWRTTCRTRIQPFHGVINYDGQLTKQNGIHARFEATLVERYNEPAGARAEAAGARPRAARLHLRARCSRTRGSCPPS